MVGYLVYKSIYRRMYHIVPFVIFYFKLYINAKRFPHEEKTLDKPDLSPILKRKKCFKLPSIVKLKESK